MDTSPRFAQACQRCWRRKQKCDRLLPECSECLRAGSRCVQRVAGRANATVADDGDETTSYTGSLLELMKRRIAFLESQADQNSDTVPSPQEQLSTGTDTEYRHPEEGLDHGNGSRDEQLMNNAVSEIQSLSLAAMSGSDQHEYGSKKNSTFVGLVKQVMSLSGTNPASSLITRVSLSDEDPLEMTTCLQDLITLGSEDLRYFTLTFCQFSSLQYFVVSQEQCLEALNAIQQVRQNTENSNINHEALYLVSVAVSIGILLSHRKRQMTDLVSRLIEVCKRLIPVLANVVSDVLIVRCLTMQILLSLYQPSAASTWYTLGLAMTKSISIGAHRQEPSESSTSVEPSSHAFWTLYTLDRQIAFAMDRPFGIEDDDVILQLPELSTQNLSRSDEDIVTCLRTWTIQHAQMLSTWRMERDMSLEIAFSSYQYWRDTYQEIVEHVKPAKLLPYWNQEGFSAFIQKQSAQLACQALVQLLIIYSKSSSLSSSLSRLREFVDQEVPKFISWTKQCTEQHDITLTFLDAYDVFAATVTYLYCHNKSMSSSQSSSTQRITSIPLGVADMKLVMTSMEIIQEIAGRFNPLQGLKEVLWAFLTAIEKKSSLQQSPQAANAFVTLETPLQILNHEIERCAASTPLHLKRLMENCLQEEGSMWIT